MNAPYDLRALPLVVGRTPAFALQIALDVMASEDPLAATAAAYRQERLRAALFAASPSLARAVDEWIDGKPLRNPKTPLRALAYLLRMCARPTPFSLCAGIGYVPVGPATTLAIEGEHAWRTVTRPDMKLLAGLAASLEASEARGAIRYVANECAIERGGRLFVTSVTLANQATSGGTIAAKQRAVNLKNTEAVEYVRRLCAEPATLADLAGALSERFAAPLPDSLRLLDQLIASGLLISELVPSPVGNPGAYLLERFEALDAPFAAELRDAVEAAAAYDRMPLPQRSVRTYEQMHERFAALSNEPVEAPLQTDLRVAFSGTLGEGILAEVERYAAYGVRMGRVATLQRLHEAFAERYEGVERLVPLLELVDDNLGIGVPDHPGSRERDVAARDALLMRLACEALRTGAQEVELDEAMLETIAPQVSEGDALFPSIEVGFAVAAASAAAVEAGEYLIVPSGFSFSDTGTKSLGRFAHLFEGEPLERMQQLARESTPPGATGVEFAFAPRESRTYNVSTRPCLYDYQLRVGIGEPAAGSALSPADLWVGIDDDRFFLWSQQLQSRVEIRETHAFATAFQAPDLCRLLAYVRYDGTRTLDEFDWGAAGGCTYLPRVRAGRVVLAARRWSFAAEGFDLALERARWNLPRYVHLADDDRRLLVDLDSPVATPLIADQSARSGRVNLVEALPAPDGEWVAASGGAHVVEFVAQGLCARRPAPVAAPAPVPVERRAVHGPGSSWTYVKLYCGRQTVTHLLSTRVAPLVEELRSLGAIDRWFFVRYGDPQNHLRLRFRATDPGAGIVRELVARRAETWLQEGTLARVVFDTYAPEYERYGGAEGLEAAEAFFTADSDQVLGLLARTGANTNHLVAAAAASFDGHLASEASTALALDALSRLAKQKLEPVDREALKRMPLVQPASSERDAFARALEAGEPRKRLADLIHMHCNRFGIDAEAESRVYALLRASALRRAAQKREREPEISGSRSHTA